MKKKVFLISLALAIIFATTAFASPPDKKVAQDVAVSFGIEADFNVITFAPAVTSPAFIGDESEAIQVAAVLAAPICPFFGSKPANSNVSVIAGNLFIPSNTMIQTNVVAYNPRGRLQALANDQGYAEPSDMFA